MSSNLDTFEVLFLLMFFLHYREALLAEMGVAIREDGGTLGVFSPKKVEQTWYTSTDIDGGGDCQISRGWWCTPFHPSLPHFCFPCYFFPWEPSLYCHWFFSSVHFIILSVFPLFVYLLPSHAQLSHESPFDEHFDCFPTTKVCLIEWADKAPFLQ